MEFVFPFVSIPVPRPVVALSGRSDRPRPLIPVVLIHPKTGASRTYRGLLDTGADDTVFHEDTARILGLDLSDSPQGNAQGTTGLPVPLRYAEVFLRIANDEGESIEWRATVAFANKRGSHPLLGFAGFLQFFNATFHGELEEVTLIPNPLIPFRLPHS